MHKPTPYTCDAFSAFFLGVSLGLLTGFAAALAVMT